MKKRAASVIFALLVSMPAFSEMEREFEASASRARLTPERRLVLEAKQSFVEASPAEQLKLYRDACSRWRVLSSSAHEGDDPEMIVVWPGGGSWWRCYPSGGTRLSEWDDTMAPYTRRPQPGRIFLFGGGQFSFGNSSGWGVTAGVGTTLFRDRMDVSIGNSFSGSADSATYVLSLSTRLRFRLDDHLGWNFGPQLQFATGSNSSSFSGALLAGLNLFLSTGGSFDATASVTTDGAYGLLTGYTFFLGGAR